MSVNPFGAEQLGYTAEELIGRPVQNLFHEADSPANLAERLVWPPEMSATGRAEHHTTRLPTLPNRLATPERTLRRRFVMVWRSERFARGTGLGCDVKDSKRFAPTGGWGFFDFNHFEPKAPTAKVRQSRNAPAVTWPARRRTKVWTQFYRLLDK